jgi:hypothetical protein
MVVPEVLLPDAEAEVPAPVSEVPIEPVEFELCAPAAAAKANTAAKPAIFNPVVIFIFYL